MDRAIRFRGRNPYSKQWVYGFYFITGMYDAQIWQDKEDFPVKVDFRTVGEYTGFEDQQGREIYEGDYLANEWGKYRIYWDRGGFVIESEDGMRHDMGSFDLNTLQVIGNQHENPEYAAFFTGLQAKQ